MGKEEDQIIEDERRRQMGGSDNDAIRQAAQDDARGEGDGQPEVGVDFPTAEDLYDIWRQAMEGAGEEVLRGWSTLSDAERLAWEVVSQNV